MNNPLSLETISISSLNSLEYCPRRFYYEVVQGEVLVNEFVLEGQLAHQRAHQPGTQTTAAGDMVITRLYLYSETLHLTGFADVIEERAGNLFPVEYKLGQQGEWLNDHVQLCAQALCLEELLADHLSEARRGSVVGGLNTKEQRQPGKPPIPHGYIFYISSRRRIQVKFTPQLRARTKAAIVQAFQIAARQTPPPPLTGELADRCPNCSLFPLCLPQEVHFLHTQKKP